MGLFQRNLVGEPCEKNSVLQKLLNNYHLFAVTKHTYRYTRRFKNNIINKYYKCGILNSDVYSHGVKTHIKLNFECIPHNFLISTCKYNN